MAAHGDGVAGLAHALRLASLDRLREAREAVGSAERWVELARLRLAASGARLEETARTLARVARGRLRIEERRLEERGLRLDEAAGRRLERERRRPPQLGQRIVAAARGRLREMETRLGGFERLARELSPRRVLERGYSITRDEDGRPVREVAGVHPGDLLTTELYSGTLSSRVDRVEESG